MNENKPKYLGPAQKIFEELGINGVFAELCEYKKLKTAINRTLVLSLDPIFW